MKTIEYPFGNFHLYESYCHLDLVENKHLTIGECREGINDLNEFYKKRTHVVISDRKFASSIDLEAYRHVNHKRMVGIAIVTTNEDAADELVKEQEIYKGSFVFFKSLNEAKDWAASFVEYATN